MQLQQYEFHNYKFLKDRSKFKSHFIKLFTLFKIIRRSTAMYITVRY